MPVMCCVCEKLFSTRSNVNKHYKKVHNIKPKIVSYDQTKWSNKCLQSDCNSSFQHNNGLINHLSEKHKIYMDTETMKFKSKEDFSAWKHLMEKENKSDYIIVRSYKLKGKLVRYYTCNRSGKKSSVSNNVRLPKSQGSCKLNRYCTSGIKVIESKDILVTWCKTHYGHSIDLQHIKIPKIDRSVIASKLALGVPTSRILDSYRDKMGDNISREDLITRKDIHNIKMSYHINILSEGVKHENDPLSVELWTKQCEEEENNPILLYKKEGVENFSAKILKTMTKLQNAEKNKLTDEVILQIESHLTTIDNLLEMPFKSPDSFIPQISHQEPGNKKIDNNRGSFLLKRKIGDAKMSVKRHPMLSLEK